MNPDDIRAQQRIEKEREQEALKHLGKGTPEWRVYEETRNEPRRPAGIVRERTYWHPIHGKETEVERMLRLVLEDKRAQIP